MDSLIMDNQSINRKSKYKSPKVILAGVRRNPFFNYNNKLSTKSNYDFDKISYTDTNYFIVQQSGGNVKFIAPDIDLEYGFTVEDSAYFETSSDSFIPCNNPPSYYRYNKKSMTIETKNSNTKSKIGSTLESIVTIKAFPNPFNNELRVSIQASDINPHQSKIMMYDFSGRVVYSQGFDLVGKKDILIDNDIPKGIYLLNVYVDELNQQIKVIKQ